MAHYVFLIAYHDGGRRRVPAHWAIMVTADSIGNAGKVYHAIGSPFHGYESDIKPSYNLLETKRRYTRTLLGTMDDASVHGLDQICMSTKAPGRSSTPLDPFAGANCQDWALDFLQELVTLGILPASALGTARSCPRE